MPKSTTQTAELLDILTQSANAVAALTGIRAQLINSGWGKQAAECVVIELLRANNKQDAGQPGA